MSGNLPRSTLPHPHMKGGNEPPPIARDFTVINKLGIHARPAALFVRAANKFRSDVFVEKDGERINGKSIMGLMMLAASQGTSIRVEASGPDAENVLNELADLIARKFDED